MGTFNIPIMDVIDLLGLPGPSGGKISYYIRCPMCDTKRNARHLNINLEKNTFRCPRCDVNGGVLDFYSLFSGVLRSEAFDDLKHRLRIEDPPLIKESVKKRQLPVPVAKEISTTDIETRDRTYRKLLSMLSLAEDHLNNLLNRGLSREDIEHNMYRTTPAAGTDQIAKYLLHDGYQIQGVPGFYINTAQNKWTFVPNSRGILIPVRDFKGRIQGLQLRKDNAEKRKFRWISSSEKEQGARACNWVHIAGEPRNRVLLTEGPLKADVIHCLTGQFVIAVPGVNSLLELDAILRHLKLLHINEIMTCFDMDMFTNWHVQKGNIRLGEILTDAGFDYGTYVWNPFYKGLDDYIWALIQHFRAAI